MNDIKNEQPELSVPLATVQAGGHTWHISSMTDGEPGCTSFWITEAGERVASVSVDYLQTDYKVKKLTAQEVPEYNVVSMLVWLALRFGDEPRRCRI